VNKLCHKHFDVNFNLHNLGFSHYRTLLACHVTTTAKEDDEEDEESSRVNHKTSIHTAAALETASVCETDWKYT
jgi:hypothetical protein